MALPLIPVIGPMLVRGLLKALPGRIAETWAPRIAKLIGLAIVVGLLWLAVSSAIGAIRKDARNDLLAEQAAAKLIADEKQRQAEAKAAATRAKDLSTGAKVDAAQQQDLTDATKDIPDSRPSDRQRARVCRELQQQDKAAGRAPRSC